MINNQKGQALIESLFCIPVLISLISFIFIGFYRVSSHYLIDHFIYQAAFCLAKERGDDQCKKQLIRKLDLIPLSQSQIDLFYIDHKTVAVKARITKLWKSETVFQQTLSLPLTAEQFRRAQ